MTPKRKQRLYIVLMFVLGIGASVGLMLAALEDNLQLFFSPSDIVAGKANTSQTIRVGGLVVEGSVNREQGNLAVRFDLTDNAENVTVEYSGILPDLFREGQGIVAMGKLDQNGVFVADEVLAKHDENYMPPEVAESLKAAHNEGVAAANKGAPQP